MQCRTRKDTHQSWISSIGYPQDLDALLEMFRRRGETVETDIQSLFEEECSWTAPPWAMPGDVVFFYLTMKAAPSIRRILREVQEYREHFSNCKVEQRNADLFEDCLNCDLQTTNRFGGSIFAYAQVKKKIIVGNPGSPHFRSRIFAPLGRARTFSNPLALRDFADIVSVRQASITPLEKRSFDRIRTRLSRMGRLPASLMNVNVGRRGFRYTNRSNWRDVNLDKATRFLDESQLRLYFADYLLSELKDPRTPILEECECTQRKARTGRVDYFVRINGTWVPVETKLSARSLSEKKLRTQLKKYKNPITATATQGKYSGTEVPEPTTPYCLVLDQQGVWVTKDGRPTQGSWDRPLMTRSKLCRLKPQTVRQKLRSAMV